MAETLHCLIVGAGPAGLVAAVYLARYKRRFVVVDADDSRLRWIPRSRNVPAFPDGVAGPELLQQLREHAARYRVADGRAELNGVRLELEWNRAVKIERVRIVEGE